MSLRRNTNSINLPVGLIRHVYHTGNINPGALRTLLYLHIKRYDHQIISPSFYKDVAKELKIDVKTVINHTKQLLAVNYIGVNKVNNRIYVRSLKKMNSQFSKSVWSVKVSGANLFHFTEFIIAATIAYQIDTCKKSARKKQRPALTCEGALQAHRLSRKINTRGFAVSLEVISKFLNRCISWVDKYKKRAAKKRLIRVKHDYIDTGFSYTVVSGYKRGNRGLAGRVRKSKNGMIMLVGIDILTSKIQLKKGKKV